MKKVIFIAVKEEWEFWKLTKPHLEAYAEAVGAEIVELPQVTPNPQWVLFHAFKASAGYPRGTRFLWIDADILVSPEAPDVFEKFPKNFFVCPPHPIGRIHPRWARGFKKFVPNPRPYPVNGLVLWSWKHAKPLADWYFKKENHTRFKPGWGDQELLAVACYELEIHFAYFPQLLHRMYSAMKPADRTRVKFLHASGGKKLKKVKNFLTWLKL